MNLSNKDFAGVFLSILVIEIALVTLVYGSVQGSSRLDTSESARVILDSTPMGNCRYGAAALGDHQVDWLDELGAGWYLDFATNAVSAPNNAEYAPLISVKQDKTDDGVYLQSYTVNPPLSNNGLGILIDARPGSLWIVGNEVDRGPDPGQIIVNQGDTYPDVYARAYHEVYHYIKNRDPRAQVANSALVQVSPGRIQYLDIMWDSYIDQFGTTMPVDVWNMHIYILPEVNQLGQPNAIANVALGTDPALAKMESYDPDGAGPLQPKDTCALEEVYCYAEHDDMGVFAEQVLAMRRWMANHGQQNKPLVLSEFSILYPYFQDPGGTCFLQDEFGNCFTEDRVINFLNNTFDYLESAADPDLGYPKDEYRLVQQWLWFSINNGRGVGFVSNLIDGEPAEMTPVGQAYQSAVIEQPNYINLIVDHVTSPAVPITPPGTSADVTLSASIKNNGNRASESPFEVTFYSDEALSQEIGTAMIQPPGALYPGLTGCARNSAMAEVVWTGLQEGLHRFWVEADSSGWIVESDEFDNVASGFVMVNPDRVYAPFASNP